MARLTRLMYKRILRCARQFDERPDLRNWLLDTGVTFSAATRTTKPNPLAAAVAQGQSLAAQVRLEFRQPRPTASLSDAFRCVNLFGSAADASTSALKPDPGPPSPPTQQQQQQPENPESSGESKATTPPSRQEEGFTTPVPPTAPAEKGRSPVEQLDATRKAVEESVHMSEEGSVLQDERAALRDGVAQDRAEEERARRKRADLRLERLADLRPAFLLVTHPLAFWRSLTGPTVFLALGTGPQSVLVALNHSSGEVHRAALDPKNVPYHDTISACRTRLGGPTQEMIVVHKHQDIEGSKKLSGELYAEGSLQSVAEALAGDSAQPEDFVFFQGYVACDTAFVEHVMRAGHAAAVALPDSWDAMFSADGLFRPFSPAVESSVPASIASSHAQWASLCRCVEAKPVCDWASFPTRLQLNETAVLDYLDKTSSM
ncbi:hypothetical protein DIPPA_02593 [Diplonema papillatum]|nr:hypothetical protein DIPPA_02593 [Diplonema papillatum]